ncbi:MAG: glycosyltransferase family 4 protein [candidate division WOR-3 bacterium]
MKGRVIFVSDVYYPYPGGISEHIHQLSKNLRDLGWETYILTTNFKEKVGFDEPPWVYRVGFPIKIPVNGSIAPVAFSPRINLYVKEILRNNGFDIVHIHGQVAPTLPILALKYSNSINVITFHAAYRKNILAKTFKPYIKGYFSRINGFIAVSPAAIEPILKHFGNIDYRIITNGVDVEKFNPNKKPLQHLMGYKNILFVGRPEPRKGLRFLINAMTIILSKVPNARLIVVGSGPLLGYYKSLVPEEIKDRVLFEGAVDSDVLPRYYRSADVFVSPATRSESFGMVLLEAMASGVPVVATNNEGYRYVVKDGENGLLSEPENEVDLANKIIRVLTDENLRQRLISNGLETAKRFSWKNIAKEVEGYYLELMGKNEGFGG